MNLLSKLSKTYTAKQVLEKAYAQIGKNHKGTKVDLTENKDDDYPGGRFVNFGWWDEHRHNPGWFRYPEMTAFTHEDRGWVIGVGIPECGYTMDEYNSDLRLLALPEGDELVPRVKEAFKGESWFKSTVLIAEDTFHGSGRLYFPIPGFYDGDGWSLEKLLWHKIIEPEALRKHLSEGYTFDWERNSVVLEPPGREKNKSAQYGKKVIPAVVSAIEELLKNSQKVN